MARAAENLRAAIQLGKGPDEVSRRVGLANIALRRRDPRSADTLFAHALGLVDTFHPTLHDAAYVAWGHAAFGDTARAVQFLERYDPRTDLHFQLHLHCDPGLDPLRARFEAVLVRKVRVCGR